jgi:hypothetical protein
MVLKIGHPAKQIRNTCEVLKCGAGEGWRRSVGKRVKNGELLQRVKEDRNIQKNSKKKEGEVDWSHLA